MNNKSKLLLALFTSFIVLIGCKKISTVDDTSDLIQEEALKPLFSPEEVQKLKDSIQIDEEYKFIDEEDNLLFK